MQWNIKTFTAILNFSSGGINFSSLGFTVRIAAFICNENETLTHITYVFKFFNLKFISINGNAHKTVFARSFSHEWRLQ